MTVTAQQVGETLAKHTKELEATVDEMRSAVVLAANAEAEYRRIRLTARAESKASTEVAKDAEADLAAIEARKQRDYARDDLHTLIEACRAKRAVIGALQSWAKLVHGEMEMAMRGPQTTP